MSNRTITRHTAAAAFASMRDARNASGTLRGRWHIRREDGNPVYWVQENAQITMSYTGSGYVRVSSQFTAELREQLEADLERHGALYVVYSYATPIAWTDGMHWTRPVINYSPTTSKHQGLTQRDGTTADTAQAMASVAGITPGYRRSALETARRDAARRVHGMVSA